MVCTFRFVVLLLSGCLSLGTYGLAQSSSDTGVAEKEAAPGSPPSYPLVIDGHLVYKGRNMGVTPPRATYQPDAKYSKQARKAKYQGTCVLWVIVGPDGHTSHIRVSRALGMGLDEKAIEAVKKWKFEPGMKDGKPVAVAIEVQLNFRLY